MSWLGKIIGGTIGFALGGPLGAVAGAVFGHAFDTESQLNKSENYTILSTSETTQMTYFVATFSMLAKLSQVDGKVSDEEISSIESFIAYDLNLTSDSRNVAMKIFNTALNTPTAFQDYAKQFYQYFRHQPELLDVMIDILLRVSVADGQFSQSEEQLIRAAAFTFNFTEEHYSHLKSKYVNDIDRYYAILNCDKNDSYDHIKSNYRKLVQEFHPDKISAKGLPDEFTKFASDKFREIQEAYEMIKKDRKIN